MEVIRHQAGCVSIGFSTKWTGGKRIEDYSSPLGFLKYRASIPCADRDAENMRWNFVGVAGQADVFPTKVCSHIGFCSVG